MQKRMPLLLTKLEQLLEGTYEKERKGNNR